MSPPPETPAAGFHCRAARVLQSLHPGDHADDGRGRSIRDQHTINRSTPVPHTPNTDVPVRWPGHRAGPRQPRWAPERPGRPPALLAV